MLIVVALAAGLTTLAWAHSGSTRALTAASPIVAGSYVGVDAEPALQRMIPRPRPDPSPTHPPTSAPARPPAAPAAPRRAPAPVAIVVGSTQQALINRDRAASGLAPLTWNSCLYTVARSNAARMAAQGYISHTNGPTRDLGCGLGGRAGENVGWWSGGINDAQLNTMFMNSPDHRANILGRYHYVATAWVQAANGHGYLAVEFS